MGVSIGFQRKIEDWIIGEDWSVAFRPFLTKANPYKARVIIAGACTQPKVDADDMYVDSLLNLSFYDEYYDFSGHSRENKGVMAFAEALSERAPVLISNINTLMVDSPQELSAQKGTVDYIKGTEVFREVLVEFQPELLILHGAEAVKQFRKQFAEGLRDDYGHIDKVQELEGIGVFAQLQLNNGSMKVLACRSLSHYGTGESFAAFSQKVEYLLG